MAKFGAERCSINVEIGRTGPAIFLNGEELPVAPFPAGPPISIFVLSVGVLNFVPRVSFMDEVNNLLRYFTYSHLPPKLQEVSAPFCKLAHELVATYMSNREMIKALDLLLAAKDAAVRSVLFPWEIGRAMEMVHFPGLLVGRDTTTRVVDAMCGSIYTEEELKRLTTNPLLVANAGESEIIEYLGGVFRFYNNGAPLDGGSNMRLTFNEIVASKNVIAVDMRGATHTVFVEAIPGIESGPGVPLLLTTELSTPFTGGNGSSFILFMCMYRKTSRL